jgi:hypothetical protein
MQPVPLGVTACLAALDWGAWDWASNTSHDTIGLVAGVLLVPALLAFAWFLVVNALGLTRIGMRRAAARRRSRSSGGPGGPTALGTTGSATAPETPHGRIAA